MIYRLAVGKLITRTCLAVEKPVPRTCVASSVPRQHLFFLSSSSTHMLPRFAYVERCSSKKRRGHCIESSFASLCTLFLSVGVEAVCCSVLAYSLVIVKSRPWCLVRGVSFFPRTRLPCSAQRIPRTNDNHDHRQRIRHPDIEVFIVRSRHLLLGCSALSAHISASKRE